MSLRGETDTQGREQSPRGQHSAALLIDCEEDQTLRAVLVGMLKERQRGRCPYPKERSDERYPLPRAGEACRPFAS